MFIDKVLDKRIFDLDEEVFFGTPCTKMQQVTMTDNNVLAGYDEGDEVYFVHSFMVVLDHQSHESAHVVYCECRITAIIQKDNIYGCQFHPEKSREPGLRILRNFADIAASA